MRIGILGGTFDPPHRGHLFLGEQTAKLFNLDKVLLMPAGDPYFKSKVSPSNFRLAMTRLAVLNNKYLSASDIEVNRLGKTYTADTLERLKQEYGEDCELFLIIGSDITPELLKWHNPKRLFELCTIISVNRPGYEQKIGALENNSDFSDLVKIEYTDILAPDISSTQIRSLVKEQKDSALLKNLLPEAVENYIIRLGLYKTRISSEEMKNRLAETISLKRFEHTINVAKEAVKLAKRWSNNPSLIKKAETAAILHDCAKNFSREKALWEAQKLGVCFDEPTIKNPKIWHQFLGEAIAKQYYGIIDSEILSAIACHTTGKPNMNLLDKLIFTADFIEEGRHEHSALKKARVLAYENLDFAVIYILKNTISYIEHLGESVHPLSLDALKYYEKEEV